MDIESVVIVESVQFTILLEPGSLSVLSVPNVVVPKCAWWIMREYGHYVRSQRNFRSILLDDDGLSIVCLTESIHLLEFLLRPEDFTLSPQKWRAFVINMASTAYELPGAVYCLANTLSSEGLSILHISTFDAEVFLIQEPDLEKAISILRQFEDPLRVQALLDQAWQAKSRFSTRLSNTIVNEILEASGSAGGGTDTLEASFGQDQENEFDESWITPQSTQDLPALSSIFMPSFREGFTLCVLPNPVILAKVREGADWSQSAEILTKLLLFDPRYSPIERQCRQGRTSIVGTDKIQSPKLFLDTEAVKSDSSSNNNHEKDVKNANFMWGLWQQGNEITFLIEERDVKLFPDNFLQTSPQEWRVVKLCGRPIAFDETGVVSAMSRINANIPSMLNISTATTNCTLVPDALLETTIRSLSAALSCPVKYIQTPSPPADQEGR